MRITCIQYSGGFALFLFFYTSAIYIDEIFSSCEHLFNLLYFYSTNCTSNCRKTLQNPSCLLLELYFILFIFFFFLNFSLSWRCPICKCHSFQLFLYNWLVVFQMVISVLQKSHFHHCRLLSQFCDHVTFRKF